MTDEAFACLVAMAAANCVAMAADDKPSIEDLFKPPKYASMRMSPDGKYLAALAPVGGRQNLIVIDIAKRDAVTITSLTKKDVVSVSWINSRRLLLRTGTIGAGQKPIWIVAEGHGFRAMENQVMFYGAMDLSRT